MRISFDVPLLKPTGKFVWRSSVAAEKRRAPWISPENYLHLQSAKHFPQNNLHLQSEKHFPQNYLHFSNFKTFPLRLFTFAESKTFPGELLYFLESYIKHTFVQANLVFFLVNRLFECRCCFIEGPSEFLCC